MIAHEQQQVEGGWTELKGEAKKHWGQLSDDELREFEGSVEEFVGMVQRKTGEARAEIEKWLCDLDAQYRPYLERISQNAREYLNSTATAAGEQAAAVREQFANGQANAEELVRKRPTESVAVAFGAGIVAGVVVGLLTKSRS